MSTVARGPAGLALDHLHGFMTALEAAGVAPGVQKQADFLRAVGLFRPSCCRELYWTACSTLVRARDELDAFDRVFEAWFGDGLVTLVPARARRSQPTSGPPLRRVAIGAEGDAVGRRQGAGRQASSEDVRGRHVFPVTSASQRSLLAEVKAALVAELPTQRARRYRPGPHGSRLDLRRSVRGAGRSGGEVVHLHWRNRPQRPRRVLLLVDVSGSLRHSSADALRFAHALVRVAPRCEVYTFGTRLTRVTRQLGRRDVGVALDSLAGVVLDVNGGTRIGSALEEFLADARRAAAARDALVVIISDGLERGDPGPMAAALERLARLSHRVVWWSPLACDPRYRPLTRAMAVVLGSLDDLVGVRDLVSAIEAVHRLRTFEAGRRPPVTRPRSTVPANSVTK
jgi:uncharacterized protein